jgi:hypothetical protein
MRSPWQKNMACSSRLVIPRGAGFNRGLRSASPEGFAYAIADHCPEAWVINYSNPMSICTRTLTKVEPGLKVFGCCHEVFGTQHLLAGLAQEALGLEKAPRRDDIRVNVSGINHFTWIDRADYRGHDSNPAASTWKSRAFAVYAQKSKTVEAGSRITGSSSSFSALQVWQPRGTSRIRAASPIPRRVIPLGVIHTGCWRIERWETAPSHPNSWKAG